MRNDAVKFAGFKSECETVWCNGERYAKYQVGTGYAQTVCKRLTRLGWDSKVTRELWERTANYDGMQDDDWRNWRCLSSVAVG